MGWLLPDVGQLWGLQPRPSFFRFLSESPDLNGDVLDSGCHLRNRILAGIRKARLYSADRLKG